MTTATASAPVRTNLKTNVLTPEQIAFYKENGYLHIPGMFTPRRRRRCPIISTGSSTSGR